MINNVNARRTIPQFKGAKEMLMVNTAEVAGKKAEHLGIVTGNIVGSRNIFKDVAAMFKSLKGGEIKIYTKLIEDLQKQALIRLQEAAKKIGADGILNVRFVQSSSGADAEIVTAYGTAVKFH